MLYSKLVLWSFGTDNAQLLENVHIILQGFLFYAVQFVSKNGNKVVYALAKLAVHQSIDFVWIDECP
jgi:hypothetical protein